MICYYSESDVEQSCAALKQVELFGFQHFLSIREKCQRAVCLAVNFLPVCDSVCDSMCVHRVLPGCSSCQGTTITTAGSFAA